MSRYDGEYMLRGLARRLLRFAPVHMERADLEHAGWLRMRAALDAGKTWGYARLAAHGAMMEEIRRWFGTPHRAAGKLQFVALQPWHQQPDDAAPRPELADAVIDLAKAELAPRQLQCTIMYLEGYSLTEIGNEYGISPSNVLAHLKAATAKLKLLCAERGVLAA